MKVTFVHVDRASYFKTWGGEFHFGLGALSAMLRQKGHDTSLIHITGGIDKDTFLGKLGHESPDLLAYTSMTPVYESILELAGWAKEEYKDLPTIIGGMHSTLNPEEVIKREEFDMLCRGEGEIALNRLCDAMESGDDISTIPNLWVKKNGNAYRNELGHNVEDLDGLPFTDRNLFDFDNLFHSVMEKEGGLLVSRGCPYQCSYCSNHALRDLYRGKGKYVRFRSVDSSIKEARQLLSDFPSICKLHFFDDILFMNKKWMRDFAPKYRAEIGLPFTCNLRLNLVDAEVIDAIKEAGCIGVRVGLESGNEAIRNEVLHRALSDEKMENGFRLLNEAGISFSTYNMVGIPGEDPGKILDTIKFNARVGPSQIFVSIYYPLSGTKLYDIAKEKTVITEKKVPDFWAGTILEHKDLTEAQIWMFYKNATRLIRVYSLVYRLPNFMARPAERVLDRFLSGKMAPRVIGGISAPVHYFRRLLGNRRHKEYELV